MKTERVGEEKSNTSRLSPTLSVTTLSDNLRLAENGACVYESIHWHELDFRRTTRRRLQVVRLCISVLWCVRGFRQKLGVIEVYSIEGWRVFPKQGEFPVFCLDTYVCHHVTVQNGDVHNRICRWTEKINANCLLLLIKILNLMIIMFIVGNYLQRHLKQIIFILMRENDGLDIFVLFFLNFRTRVNIILLTIFPLFFFLFFSFSPLSFFLSLPISIILSCFIVVIFHNDIFSLQFPEICVDGIERKIQRVEK